VVANFDDDNIARRRLLKTPRGPENVCSTPAFMSTTPFNFAAGAMFGMWVGTAVMLAGCVIGSLFNFLLARYFARDWAKRKMEQSGALTGLHFDILTYRSTNIRTSSLKLLEKKEAG
jgi:hypothetical protein